MRKTKDRKKAEETVVAEEILQSARRSLETDRLGQPAKRSSCTVCGAECAPTSAEDLCWVCRRLKISAWGDSDQMLSAQE